MHKLLPACIVLLISSGACQPRENAESIKAINRSLIEANKLLAVNNEMIYETMSDKLRDSRTELKAGIWTPRARAVRDVSAGIYKYVDSLKQKLAVLKDDDRGGVQQLFHKEGDRLYHYLVRYAEDVVNVLDTAAFSGWPNLQDFLIKKKESFRKDISDRFHIKVDGMPETSASPESWRKIYVENATPMFSMTMLNKIQCNILVTESILIDYCNGYTMSINHSYTVFRAIATLSSSYVKTGQIIEVIAGVGEFSAAMRPAIDIGDHVVKINEDGVAVYTFKANGMPGKHFIPVKFKHIKPDGSEETISKKLEYIIAE